MGNTQYSYMKFIQNEGKSVLIIGLYRNLAKSIKWNNIGCAVQVLNNRAQVNKKYVVVRIPGLYGIDFDDFFHPFSLYLMDCLKRYMSIYVHICFSKGYPQHLESCFFF